MNNKGVRWFTPFLATHQVFHQKGGAVVEAYEQVYAAKDHFCHLISGFFAYLGTGNGRVSFDQTLFSAESHQGIPNFYQKIVLSITRRINITSAHLGKFASCAARLLRRFNHRDTAGCSNGLVQTD